jgi:hypothetical protein
MIEIRYDCGMKIGWLLFPAIFAAAGLAQDQVRLGLFTAMPEKWNLEANWPKPWNVMPVTSPMSL